MKFNKIVCVDHTKLNEEAISDLQELSENKVEVRSDYPETRESTIERIGDADAVLVSWHTQIDEQVIKACPDLKYIGMACSLYDEDSANVAVKYAREKGITVTGIEDYGDPGVAEFIISELIQLLNGYKDKQFKDTPVELTGLKIGIIGLGVTGKLLAECLVPFGADLYYHSKTRKPEWEAKEVKYLNLPDILEECEIVSLHLPKNTVVLGEAEFKKLGSPKILINTSLGLPFDEKAFQDWMKVTTNFAIFDGDARKALSQDSCELKNVIALKTSAGWSSKTRERLSLKVLENLKQYLSRD